MTENSKPKDGGPAFPLNPDINFDYTGNIYPEAVGMTFRQYAAVHALKGIGNWTPGTPHDPWEHEKIREARAEWAVAQADALIKALEKEHD